MLTERSSVRDKQKKLFLFDFGINSGTLQTKQEMVRDGVSIGSEFNETNTTSAKKLRDLGPKVKEAVPEMYWHFKP